MIIYHLHISLSIRTLLLQICWNFNRFYPFLWAIWLLIKVVSGHWHLTFRWNSYHSFIYKHTKQNKYYNSYYDTDNKSNIRGRFASSIPIKLGASRTKSKRIKSNIEIVRSSDKELTVWADFYDFAEIGHILRKS